MDANYPALVLNADFTPVSVHPLSVWGFERTLRNFLKERVTPLDYHDATLRSPSFEYRPPSVVALKQYVKRPNRVVFTRMNIFLRDNFTCQYCQKRFSPEDLTFDHVIPRSKGGDTSFENIVAACASCNTKKGDSYDMVPIREPVKPTARQLAKASPPNVALHNTWLDWLYWSGVLEQNTGGE